MMFLSCGIVLVGGCSRRGGAPRAARWCSSRDVVGIHAAAELLVVGVARPCSSAFCLRLSAPGRCPPWSTATCPPATHAYPAHTPRHIHTRIPCPRSTPWQTLRMVRGVQARSGSASSRSPLVTRAIISFEGIRVRGPRVRAEPERACTPRTIRRVCQGVERGHGIRVCMCLGVWAGYACVAGGHVAVDQGGQRPGADNRKQNAEEQGRATPTTSSSAAA